MFRYLVVTSDVLTSVKKMEESLRRLRTARGTSSAGGSQGMSDDDKIRLQLCLDVKELRTQVKSDWLLPVISVQIRLVTLIRPFPGGLYYVMLPSVRLSVLFRHIVLLFLSTRTT